MAKDTGPPSNAYLLEEGLGRPLAFGGARGGTPTDNRAGNLAI
jgi:hypothetical protein